MLCVCSIWSASAASPGSGERDFTTEADATSPGLALVAMVGASFASVPSDNKPQEQAVGLVCWRALVTRGPEPIYNISRDSAAL